MEKVNLKSSPRFYPERTKVYNFVYNTTIFACSKELISLTNKSENDSLLAVE